VSGKQRKRGTRFAASSKLRATSAAEAHKRVATSATTVSCEICQRVFDKGERALSSHVRQRHIPWDVYTARYLTSYATPIEKALGIAIEPNLLHQSLTHRSYAYENGGLPTNERLEFLGDSVLGVVVTSALYRDHPDLPEGRLAKLRANVVNSRALAEVARGLGLGPHLLLGRGEETTGGRDKESILADTLEAMLGAIYLQPNGGLSVATDVIHRLFDPLMAQAARLGAGLDWKTSLQELTAGRTLGVPDYQIEQTGPDHAKTFTAWVVVAGNRFGGVHGRTKKEAEQRAAQAAFAALSTPTDSHEGRRGAGAA
jgi:ribonuclease-3